MVNMCEYVKPYKCKICQQEMLFFMAKNGTLFDYKKIYGRKTPSEVESYLREQNIIGIKCIICDKSFIMDWRYKYPEMLVDDDCINKFRKSDKNEI